LAYFGNLRPATGGSVLENAVVAPVSTDAASAVPAPVALPASGAAQIPTK